MTREFTDTEVVPGTRYRVVRQLGEGGMGSVYLVEHTELGKRFVLKSLFRELQSRKDLVARLRQEWRALGRLNHPNIVNVSDAGTSTNGIPYYVMEYVEGETLLDLLKRERALAIPRAIAISVSVLEALSAAHAIGIVHRDVKPPNIYLTASGEVKLLDFGVAKLADQNAEVITARGVAIGTPRYMSPEQAKGHAVDGRADLYAVGLVLFEAIAGQGPFDDARDANELLLFHITKAAPRLTNFHRGVSAELAEIVAALLAKDPVDRPGSARQVATSLRALKPVDTPALVDAPTPPLFGEAPTEAAPAPSSGGSGDTTTKPVPAVPSGDLTTPFAAPTRVGMDWAKEGFDTVAAPPPSEISGADTEAVPALSMIDSTPSPASHGAKTVRLDLEPSNPPDAIPTRTAAPFQPMRPAPVEPAPSFPSSQATPARRQMPIWIFIIGALGVLSTCGLVALVVGSRGASPPPAESSTKAAGASNPIPNPQPESKPEPRPEPQTEPQPNPEQPPEPEPQLQPKVEKAPEKPPPAAPAVKDRPAKPAEPAPKPAEPAPKAAAPAPKPKSSGGARPLPASGL